MFLGYVLNKIGVVKHEITLHFYFHPYMLQVFNNKFIIVAFI